MATGKEFTQPTRRAVLTMLGQVGLLIACREANDDADELRTGSAEVVRPSLGEGCAATPAQDEGPFFVEEGLLRSDLTLDTDNVNVSNGVPLRFQFSVYRYRDGVCSPFEGVHVDVWHADTVGLYSDQCTQGTLGDRSLRGYQISDARGAVQFSSIFPGWYAGRTIHVHVKLRAYSGSALSLDFTTQLYIADEISDRVLATPPYDSRGPRSTTNRTDALYTSTGEGGGMPIRLPADICETSAAGGTAFGPMGRPMGAPGGAAPTLSENSVGPRLELELQEDATTGGYVASFAFGIEGA